MRQGIIHDSTVNKFRRTIMVIELFLLITHV